MKSKKNAQKIKNYRTGKWAEYLSVLYMMCKGYWPVIIRYKCSQGEVDLVVKNGKSLIFVEVKYRKKLEEGLESIHARNQLRVRRAAEHFIAKHPVFSKYGDKLCVRFDAIVVRPYFRFEHIRNAF
jgi:putative endonuclease